MTQHRNLTRSPALEYIANAREEVGAHDHTLNLAQQKLLLAIVEARGEGHTLQEIGDAAGITRERVRQLLQKPQP